MWQILLEEMVYLNFLELFLASLPEVGPGGMGQWQFFSFGGTSISWMLRKNADAELDLDTGSGGPNVYVFEGVSEELYRKGSKKN